MVSTPNRVETSILLPLPLGDDADNLGRDLSWLTWTIMSDKVSSVHRSPKNADFQTSLMVASSITSPCPSG
jgi:hypothetical protein